MLLSAGGRLAGFAALGARLLVACDAGEAPTPPVPEVVSAPEPLPPAIGNIVMIVIDALRADTVRAFEGVSCAGPSRMAGNAKP